jgi:ribosomal protein L7/L12
MEWFLFAIIFILVTWAASASLTARYRAEIRRLEQKVDFLYRKFEIDYGKEQAASLPGQVRDLAASGDKIGAIKAYREATGADLVTSKHAIDGLVAGGAPPFSAPSPVNQPGYPEITPLGRMLSPEVMRLVESGNKIQAIKLHREQTRVGLKEAKDAVEVYERELKLK